MDDGGQEEADLEAHRDFDSFSWGAQKSCNLRYEGTEEIKSHNLWFTKASVLGGL